MFETFTERGRKVMALAREEALRAGDEGIDVDHLLLALIAERGGVAARILRLFEVDVRVEALRTEMRSLKATVLRGGPTGAPFSSEAARVLASAVSAASRKTRPLVGTEDILSALLEGGNLASESLVSQGWNLEGIRKTMAEFISSNQG